MAEEQDPTTHPTSTITSKTSKSTSRLASAVSFLWDRKIDSFTNFYREEVSSRQARGPQHGVGFDPVQSHAAFTQATGPLRRRQHRNTAGSTNVSSHKGKEDEASQDRGYEGITRPEEYFSPEEERRWMESSQAAKILQFKEEELSTLTREKLEERWAKLYKERQFSATAKEEIMVATEVLLEYLDSTTFTKKNRLYYHRLLDNTRCEIDRSLQEQRNAWRVWGMRSFGVLVLGAGVVVLLAAAVRREWIGGAFGSLPGTNIQGIGSKAGDYLTMSFLQPKNFEPPPDYNTRYFVTPSAMEVEEKLAAEAAETNRWLANDDEDDEDEDDDALLGRGIRKGDGNYDTIVPLGGAEAEKQQEESLHPSNSRREGGWRRLFAEGGLLARLSHRTPSPPSTSSSSLTSGVEEEGGPHAARFTGNPVVTHSISRGVLDTAAELELRQEKAAGDRAEAHELLQLFHEGQEWKKQQHQTSKLRTSQGATGKAFTAGEAKEKRPTGEEDEAMGLGRRTAENSSSFASNASFWDVSRNLASNFGGGSRIQRMMASTTERTQMQEEVRKKMEERF